jgi:hydroxymethylbilane synthase
MVQTNLIIDKLDCDVHIKKILTKGDKVTDVALAKIEGKGFFTKELDQALLAGEIDFAVHSLKDLPTDLPEGIVIAAIPKRESANDALVGAYKNLNIIPKNAKIGTSSLRRKAEILKFRPDLNVAELRGNIDTRLRKLNEKQYDAIIVAEAGLLRLGYKDYSPLPPKEFIPAVCQGALGVTTRKDDIDILEIISKLEHSPSKIACEAERTFLTNLEAGCQVPAGAYSKADIENETYEIHGFISSMDGKQFIRDTLNSKLHEANKIASKLAKNLLFMGGNEILDKIRR